jgi:hypothetical protein
VREVREERERERGEKRFEEKRVIIILKPRQEV